MKKCFYLIAAMAVMAVACKSVPEEQKVADFEAYIEQFMAEYSDKVSAIQADSVSTDEEKRAKFEEIYEATCDALVAECKDVIKKNPESGAAVLALKNIVGIVEPEEVEALIAKLKGIAAEDEFVIQYKELVAVKKATAEGQMFTDFTVVQDENDPEGSTVKFSDFVGKGKYVLVDFWASWCGPCKRELPNIAAVYEKYKGDDFDVLSIAVWDKPEDTIKGAQEHGIVWSQIINAQQIPTDIYGIEGIPHIMLVGPDGTILKRDLRGEAIEKAVAEALGR
ncbi:MAG: TlpA family protein disulfide reductase [Bacteroidales bacterium]|nr:TlpA family protein disulfide reductase [Bacteroidales bacterium]